MEQFEKPPKFEKPNEKAVEKKEKKGEKQKKTEEEKPRKKRSKENLGDLAWAFGKRTEGETARSEALWEAESEIAGREGDIKSESNIFKAVSMERELENDKAGIYVSNEEKAMQKIRSKEEDKGLAGLASDLNKKEKKEFIDDFNDLEERYLVIKNPNWVGINFDQEFIVDDRNFWSLKQRLNYLKQRDGVISPDILSKIESGEVQRVISQRQESEKQKMRRFREYVEDFQGNLKHIRINPAGETSSVSPSQAIEVKKDRSFEVKISPEFIEQIKVLTEQSEDVTLVVPFYNHRRDKERVSDVPETEEQIQQYIALCQDIIEKTGGLAQLEIGNETNISRSTGAEFRDKLQHASHVNSAEYANFYYKVARNIKEKFPEVKLSVAGVACFDPTYLREVLTEIKRLRTEEKVDTKLVNSISFHPYRNNPRDGSIEIKNGNFTINKSNYQEQLNIMKKLSAEFGTELNVGEINFPFSDPEWEEKLKGAIFLTKDQNVVSLIYPGIHV